MLSGTRSFSQTRDSICQAAMRKCGALAKGATAINATELADAIHALNSMVMSWQTDNVFLWESVQVSQTLTQGVSAYLFNDEYIDISGTYLQRLNDDLSYPMEQKSIDNWADISLKDLQDIPSQYFLYPTLGQVTIKLYPVPDQTGDMFIFEGTKKLQDFNNDTIVSGVTVSGNTDADFPSMWSQALIWGLSAELGPEYTLAAADQQILEAKFAKAYAMAKGSNMETGSTFIIPRRRR